MLLAGAGVWASPIAAAAPEPQTTGRWLGPFEEGGLSEPGDTNPDGSPAYCTKQEDGRLVCKPTAVSSAALPNGKILYFNGIEGSENVEIGLVPNMGQASRDSQSRVLSLFGPAPAWTTPTPEGGGGSNPEIDPGEDGSQDPFGQLGVPGRGGDGLAGSLCAQTPGCQEQQPTSPPDDPENNDGDMFCTDIAQLADGRILIAGGTDWYNEPDPPGDDNGILELEGLRNTRIFDPATNSFEQVGHMKYGRWYPGLVTLPDGKVFVASGVTKLIKDTQGSQVRRSETFDPATNTWTENFANYQDSENSLPLMPRLFLTPNGKIFYNGVGQMWGPFGQAADEALMATRQFFDPATNKWEVVGPAIPRSGAFAVALPMTAPYDEVSILTFGGTVGPPPGGEVALTLSTVTTVDKNGKVSETATGSLNNRRWFSSGVALPTGEVLAVSGGDKDEVVVPGSEMPVREAELYDPVKGTWSRMTSGARDRTYHNSAFLLGDGRVFVGGHSPISNGYGAHQTNPGHANNFKDPSFEIFEPPYLFRGERPEIRRAPAGLAWGRDFEVTIEGGKRPPEITSVALMRMPSPQHVVDSDPRTLMLDFTQDGNRLQVQAPPDGVAAPPGYYYLTVTRQSDEGPVPSTAAIVQLGTKRGGQAFVYPDRDTAEAEGAELTALGSAAAGQASAPGTSALAAVERREMEPLSTSQGRLMPPVVLVAALSVLGVGYAAGRRWLRSRIT